MKAAVNVQERRPRGRPAATRTCRIPGARRLRAHRAVEAIRSRAVTCWPERKWPPPCGSRAWSGASRRRDDVRGRRRCRGSRRRRPRGVTLKWRDRTPPSASGFPGWSTWLIPRASSGSSPRPYPVAVGTAQECLFTAGNLGSPARRSLFTPEHGGVRQVAAIQLASRPAQPSSRRRRVDEKLERPQGCGLDHGIDYSDRGLVERTAGADGRRRRRRDPRLGRRPEPGRRHRRARLPRDARQRRRRGPRWLSRRGARPDAKLNTLRGVFPAGTRNADRAPAHPRDDRRPVQAGRAWRDSRGDRPDLPARGGRRGARIREPPFGRVANI